MEVHRYGHITPAWKCKYLENWLDQKTQFFRNQHRKHLRIQSAINTRNFEYLSKE